MNEQKIYTLSPNWKYNLLAYIVSIVLLPVFGIGIIVFWYYWRRISHKEYQISDESVTSIENGVKKTIAISDIEKLSITQTWSEEKGHLGTLHISGQDKNLTLIGIEEAEDIKEALEIALAKIEQRRAMMEKAQGHHSDIKIGGLEQMNQLVGLWQQGLISDEDFEKEKDKFV